MKLGIAALALAFVPCSAFATPVYLKCQLDPGAKGGVGGEDLLVKAPMDVTLNEAAGTVTYVFSAVWSGLHRTRGVHCRQSQFQRIYDRSH